MEPTRMALGAARGRGTLGTFAGVFTPSVLTILGIILFLRLGYVVGSAGLGRTLAIIGLSTLLVVLTSVSLSAIATNLTVKGGGDYYLISRTLGVEFGGAIGVVLFLAQAVSIAFYCIGFGEAVAGLLPLEGPGAARGVALTAVALLFVFAWLGADWATRFQYVVMVVLGAALVSFVLGGIARWEQPTFAANWIRPVGAPGFWVLFAIFFPAVTGFTQGVSMSGDLKDPGSSIPRGTFAAVGLATVVYLGAAVLFAGVLPSGILREDYGAMQRVARFAWLIDAGVMAATLSSGMASFLGAPRILQSMARDRIFGVLAPFAQGIGAADNPRRGVLLAAAIAVVTIALGNLNVIAPVVSMFFLISYGLLNYATYYEARARSPSFRPRFPWFDQRLSLLGFVGCVGAVIAIDATTGVIAAALLFALYQYLQRTAGPARWADGSRSYHFQRIREHLFGMAADPEHPRDWRPQLLVFSSDSHRREQLLRFASWLESGSGLTTVVKVLESSGNGDVHARRKEAEEELRRNIAQAEVEAFPLVVNGPDLATAAHLLLQSFGIGPIRANTILVNWLEEHPPDAPDEAGERRYGRHLQLALRLGCNVVVLAAEEHKWAWLEALPPNRRRIDVWWWNDATSRLMLLLAYLMTRSTDARIRVLACTSAEKAVDRVRVQIEEMLAEVRIDADVEIVVKADAVKIAETSTGTALVLIPMRLRGTLPRGPFGGSLEELLAHLPITACVIAARDIELHAEPDVGKAAELAAALDAAKAAAKEARAAEAEAAKLAASAERLRAELAALEPAVPSEKRSEIESTAQETTAAARKAAARAKKAQDKAHAAAEQAEALGAPPAKEAAAEEASAAGADPATDERA